MASPGHPALAAAPAVARFEVSPYVHFDDAAAYNPLTDQTLPAGDPLHVRLLEVRLRGGAGDVERDLVAGGWVVESGADLSRRHRLKIVSLETNTVCNQSCYFCPVSIDPRPAAAMPDELFDSIMQQLTEHRSTLEAVFLQSYNEPTVDRRFVEHCRRLFQLGLPVAVLSNGSGLTPQKVDALIEHGPLRYLAVNLSTLDRGRYAAERGADHLEAVLRNLDYAKDRPLAELMKIVVLGKGDEHHRQDHEAIVKRFAGTRFEVEPFEVMDRAGYLDVGLKALDRSRPLAGCDNVGSRPLQHLHITPAGKCIFCCEDYDEEYVVGDLTRQSVNEVLEGDELARLRRWTYGVEEAPESFMCRGCIYARRT